MLSALLFSLVSLSSAAEPQVAADREVETSIQAAMTGAVDPRVRVSRHAEGHRWGLQASVQVYRHGAGWSVTPAPLLAAGDNWVAPRIGLLWRTSAGERLHFELGAAFNPIGVIEAFVLGGRTDLPVLGATFMSAIGGYHSLELTTALALDVTERMSVWGGCLVSAESLWWDGASMFDEPELTERETLEFLQPSVGVSLSF